MCRMLGIKNFDYQKQKDIIQNFFSLAENGKVPPNSSKGHLDGWGIGWYEDNQAKLYKSRKSIIEEKEIFFQQIEKIKKTKILIIHLRKSAWRNTDLEKNSHPFKDDLTKIIFAHNGTIKDYQRLFKYIYNKDTNLCPDWLDSETYFWLLINNYKKINNLKDAFFETVNKIKTECNFSSLTCIFSDGSYLYCFREFTELPDYYTIYLTEINNSIIACSERLHNLKWNLIKPSELMSF